MTETGKLKGKLTQRRDFLLGSAAAAAAFAGASTSADAAMKPAPGEALAPLSMSNDGRYETVPLAKPSIRLGVVQTRVQAVDAKSPDKGLKDNLAHMLKAIDKAFHFAAPPDILQFHEFPITGWNTWTKKEIERFAIEVPGEQTEAIGAKAKEHGCYVVFGSYVKDPDWPNHILSITSIIGPDGTLVDKHWKARNIKGVFPGVDLFTTTIYDVLEEYIEMYGPDAVIPITRTPYGNLATSSVQREPELFRAFAMKGAEIFLRTASGGFSEMDVTACAYYNGVYSTMCSNAVSPGNTDFFEDSGASAGGSMIVDPRGKLLSQAREHEAAITATIPMESFRKRHRQPIVHQELYDAVLASYQNPYGPNLFTEYQPADLLDAHRYLRDKSRWK